MGSKPVAIEDEPSHEIYATIIGRDVAKILPHSALCFDHTQNSSQKVSFRNLPSRGSSIVPSDCEQLSRNEQSLVGKKESDRSKDGSHSFSDFYQRALDSIKKDPLSQLSLDKKNKGFQMLTRMGFREKDGGLGKSRQGHMCPMKTVLKCDKRGLGSGKKLKAKVTHLMKNVPYSNADISNIKKETLSERKRRLKDEANNEQIKMRRARMMINSDLPDEYGVYLGIHPFTKKKYQHSERTTDK